MPFVFNKCEIPGLVIIEPRAFADDRGFFLESYKKSDFVKNGIDIEFLQDNHSLSSKGVLRGLHYQKPPYTQAKLVRVIKGLVWDVAVDIRKNSPTYKKWFGIELSEENRRMFYIPEGFAHGFLVLSDAAEFLYKTTDYWAPEYERTIAWNDPDLAIAWPLKTTPILSNKDAGGTAFHKAEKFP